MYVSVCVYILTGSDSFSSYLASFNSTRPIQKGHLRQREAGSASKSSASTQTTTPHMPWEISINRPTPSFSTAVHSAWKRSCLQTNDCIEGRFNRLCLNPPRSGETLTVVVAPRQRFGRRRIVETPTWTFRFLLIISIHAERNNSKLMPP